ncbi:hypothetical protein FY528_00555 [Hymenobacter lutimineralis]|uniref:Uncharacterized protein n=1 Tax=Hymenobacter lutimineralis TaxID=2606448 RepID=A0A5D6VG73_9BACT|nr:hypothetical protein [Hymenobacter lutimineralis]TYZ14257.1 hypothetical protein FY528_00555 [Hymenobacter lutimineralis]
MRFFNTLRLTPGVLVAAGAMLVLPGCAHDTVSPECTTLATARDLTGLDGCRMVLELADGSRLEPSGEIWQNFPAKDGEQVFISYETESRVSICMVGPSVRVTCIRAAAATTN